MEIATLNKQETVARVGQKHYNQLFTSRGLDYTRNIVFSLIFLQIFFQRNLFRKLRTTAISSTVKCDQCFWSDLRKCALQTYEAPDLGGLPKNNYAFHFTFFKNGSVSFAVSLTINTHITFHKSATVYIFYLFI